MAQNPQKVLILDFDGPVTNRLSVLFTGSAFDLNPLIMGIINHICKASGAKLVISSNRAPLNKKHETMALLEKAGFDCQKHLHTDWSCSYEHTQLLSQNKAQSALVRTRNIQTWLDNHPEVIDYVVIDDLKLSIPNFVQSKDINNGISAEEINQICTLLGITQMSVIKAANPHGRMRLKNGIYPVQQPNAAIVDMVVPQRDIG